MAAYLNAPLVKFYEYYRFVKLYVVTGRKWPSDLTASLTEFYKWNRFAKPCIVVQ